MIRATVQLYQPDGTHSALEEGCACVVHRVGDLRAQSLMVCEQRTVWCAFCFSPLEQTLPLGKVSIFLVGMVCSLGLCITSQVIEIKCLFVPFPQVSESCLYISIYIYVY